ncbi:glutamate-cysteine ligase-domain-containing protein [Chaetomium strumarium]|uniref:Glutamate--cysteine ligase n=1 Tax=Chaetomium strumarium TaxID=1170767 RepID=A0AAJ0GMN4_9PEZI|nr:glutamate-cysteine ligase-domain-containing protein [Chaetomium strumarium]
MPLENDRWRTPKSRYASNSTYISEDPRLRPEYFDSDLVIDENIKQQLLDGGMDDRLATHFAHLFIRDPIVIFSEDLKELDLTKTDHFENIRSTNWQHMRFKPPAADNSIGSPTLRTPPSPSFIVLITRVILSYNLNFYITIKKVDENMQTAHARAHPLPSQPPRQDEDEEDGDFFPGLIPLAESYLDSVNVDVATRCRLATYLEQQTPARRKAVAQRFRVLASGIRRHSGSVGYQMQYSDDKGPATDAGQESCGTALSCFSIRDPSGIKYNVQTTEAEQQTG